MRAAVATVRQAVAEALRRRDLAAATEAVQQLAALHAASGGPPTERAAAQAELGDLWSLLSEYASARRCYAEAVELAPREPRFWFNRAAVSRFLGDLEGAEADYDRALLLDPNDAQAYLNRSELRVQTRERNHVAELEKRLAARSGDWQYEVRLRYALAKEYEDLGEYALSWPHLAAGSAVRRKHLQYDARVDLATVDWIRESFPSDLRGGPGDPSTEPIFVLGMPRTGSTLIDRILGRHVQVYSAGELQDFGAAVVSAVQARRGSTVPRRQLVADSATLDFAALGNDYLRRTRPRTGHTPHFTDKLPLNYLYCGLITRALPNARIVHVTRDPMATCYSIYKVLFVQGYPFSYDLAELADYYIGYRRLMAHWHATLPERIIDIAYEDLVKDPEREMRRLFAALALPWQPQCLDFAHNPDPVATASAAQVRRPLYDSSISTWRHYEAQLSPLAARLELGGISLDR